MRDFRSFVHSFVFTPPLSPDEVAALQRSDDPWESLAHLVHQASLGDFSEIARVESLLRDTPQTLFWHVASVFAGLAAPWDTLERIAASFDPAPAALQYPLSCMLAYACNPSFTERLLQLHEAATDDETRQGVAWNLSFLLEPQNGLVWIGPRETDKYGDDEDDDDGGEEPDYANMSFAELFAKKRDHAGYRVTVQQAVRALPAAGVRDGDAVLEGAPLDARQLARRIAERAGAGEDTRDRLVEEIVVLSALTGVDFAPLLTRPGGLHPLDVCSAMETLLDDPALDALSSGQRHFMGHRVP